MRGELLEKRRCGRAARVRARLLRDPRGKCCKSSSRELDMRDSNRPCANEIWCVLLEEVMLTGETMVSVIAVVFWVVGLLMFVHSVALVTDRWLRLLKLVRVGLMPKRSRQVSLRHWQRWPSCRVKRIHKEENEISQFSLAVFVHGNNSTTKCHLLTPSEAYKWIRYQSRRGRRRQINETPFQKATFRFCDSFQDYSNFFHLQL